jgi:hypothetical protein
MLSGVYAQNFPVEKYMGFHAGAGFSTIHFLPPQGARMRLLPYNIGAIYRFYAEKYVGLQLELNYGMRGYNYLKVTDTLGGTVNTKVVSHVMELPASMRWRILITKNLTAYISGIVYIAYYMRSTETQKSTPPVTQPLYYDNWDNLDFGAGGELGMGYKIGNIEVGIDGRFTVGLLELFKQTSLLYESLPMQGVVYFSVLKRF